MATGQGVYLSENYSKHIFFKYFVRAVCVVIASPTHTAQTDATKPVVKILSKRLWIAIGARPEKPKLEPKGPRAEMGFPTADQCCRAFKALWLLRHLK